MALTRDFKATVKERSERDPDFAAALLNEAISLFFNNEPQTARLILRELVNSTIGFEELAVKIDIPSKSLHRMLSARGNPTMDKLMLVVSFFRSFLNVKIEVKTALQAN
jgi:DNA-binding phage protein